MCIIIAKPAGVERLDPDYFDRAWTRNPDGGGLVWKEKDGEVTMQKGFMSKADFLGKIDELNQTDTAFIAHFRIKSVGAVCAENTHPFVMDHVTYAHNGTLGIEPFEGKTDSETFGLCFLKDKPMSWIKDYQVLLEMALGTSKFAIMDNETGEILILNRENGKERDGAWFSNESAFKPAATILPARTYPSYGNYSSLYNDYDYGDYKYKARKDWGTKKYSKPMTYIGQNAVAYYSATKEKVAVCGLSKVVEHKRGFWIIDPDIKVPAEAEPKKYKTSSPEVRIANKMQKELMKSIKEYQGFEFDTYYDRDDAELEMSAAFTVIKAIYAFVKAGKKIDDKEFLGFCLDNTEPDTWVTKVHNARIYSQYVEFYASEVLDELDKVNAQKA